MKKLFAIILSILFFSQGFYAFAVTKVFKTGAPATTNLVSYYQLEDLTTDFFGANTLTNNNGVATSTGKVVTDGAAFAGDTGSANSTSYLENTANDYGIAGGNYSVCMWVNINTALGANTRYFLLRYLNTSFAGFGLEYRSISSVNSVRFYRHRTGIADDIVIKNTTLTVGTWYHLCNTYDGSLVEGWINDVSAGTTTSSGVGNTSDQRFSLFMLGDGVLFPASAKIDEVAVFSRKLSDTDIANLYNSGTGQTMIIQTAAAVTRRRLYIIQ